HRRQERAHRPLARVRTGEHAPLRLPARGERRLPARRGVARRARRAALARARRGRGRGGAAPPLRGVVRPPARARQARDPDLRRRDRGARDPARGALAALAAPARARARGEPVRAEAEQREAQQGSPGRSGGLVKVLFFVRELPYVQRIYAPVVHELRSRGHDVHLAFTKKVRRDQLERRLAHFAAAGVTYGYAPHRRESDGWRAVAWLVRSIADLARYT